MTVMKKMKRTVRRTVNQAMKGSLRKSWVKSQVTNFLKVKLITGIMVYLDVIERGVVLECEDSGRSLCEI